MKLKRNKVYGDYKYIKPVIKNDIQKRGAICEHCGRKKLFSKKELLNNPVCPCKQVPAVISSDVVEAMPAKLAKLKKLKVHETYTRFKDQVNELQSKLDMDTVDAKTNFQIQTLKMLIDLIPIAEYEYRQFPKASNMQSLTSSITQVRELLADVMIDEDKGDLANRVIDNIIQPYTKDILQQLLIHHYNLIALLQQRVDTKTFKRLQKDMESNIRELGSTLSQKSTFYTDKIREDLT